MSNSNTSIDDRQDKLMGKHKAIVIEFVGPPGTGKTTNCVHFANALKSRNLKTFVFQDLQDYLYSLPPHKKAYLLMRSLLFRSNKLLPFSITLIRYGIYSLDSVYRYFKLTVYNEVLSQFLKNKEADIILLDQWVIQGIWSSTIFKAKQDIIDRINLSNYFFDTNCVMYFDIDAGVASERIARRKTNMSRFDRMSDDIRYKKLEQYNKYLYRLYKNSTCNQKIVFNTDRTPDANTKLFVSYLNSSFNYSI